MRRMVIGWLMAALLVMSVGAQGDDELVFGVVLLGSEQDWSWNQAHYEAGLFAERQLNARMVTATYAPITPEIALVPQAEDLTLASVVETMIVEESADIIFLTSVAYKPELYEFAERYATTPFVLIGDDDVLMDAAPDNVSNVMLQMEWGKLVEGCAAALATQNGHIGYVAAMRNAESRRFAVSAYLGARYCYEHYRGEAPESLDFELAWMGYWYYVDAQTTNAPQVLLSSLIIDGADVMLADIYSQGALPFASERQILAGAFNSPRSCGAFGGVCLGSAYYNWRQVYVDQLQMLIDDKWTPTWDWEAPDFSVMPRSAIGYDIGGGFPTEQRPNLQDFIDNLAAYHRSPFAPDNIALWEGPLWLADGTLLAEPGELLNLLDIWYLPQLLDGMTVLAGS